MPPNTKCTEEVLQAIEDFLAANVKERDAAVAAGVSYRAYQKWCRNQEIFDRMCQAKARGKASLISTAHAAAVTGFTVKETRIKHIPNKEGTAMVVGEVLDIIKELPPDHRATFAMLRANFPEEFAHVNRLDVKKVGGINTGQVDKDSIPAEIDNPRALLEMVLDGEGKYTLDDDDEDDEDVIDVKAALPAETISTNIEDDDEII
jgi:hypothetical protein